ncbi:MAG TPA: hypothetical protein VLG76_01820 [Rhabdochlamydiaceae bacterium]|nr:hypothetical protein [Rhabdochlamydiaceae bacterium]
MQFLSFRNIFGSGTQISDNLTKKTTEEPEKKEESKCSKVAQAELEQQRLEQHVKALEEHYRSQFLKRRSIQSKGLSARARTGIVLPELTRKFHNTSVQNFYEKIINMVREALRSGASKDDILNILMCVKYAEKAETPGQKTFSDIMSCILEDSLLFKREDVAKAVLNKVLTERHGFILIKIFKRALDKGYQEMVSFILTKIETTAPIYRELVAEALESPDYENYYKNLKTVKDYLATKQVTVLEKLEDAAFEDNVEQVREYLMLIKATNPIFPEAIKRAIFKAAEASQLQADSLAKTQDVLKFIRVFCEDNRHGVAIKDLIHAREIALNIADKTSGDILQEWIDDVFSAQFLASAPGNRVATVIEFLTEYREGFFPAIKVLISIAPFQVENFFKDLAGVLSSVPDLKIEVEELKKAQELFGEGTCKAILQGLIEKFKFKSDTDSSDGRSVSPTTTETGSMSPGTSEGSVSPDAYASAHLLEEAERLLESAFTIDRVLDDAQKVLALRVVPHGRLKEARYYEEYPVEILKEARDVAQKQDDKRIIPLLQGWIDQAIKTERNQGIKAECLEALEKQDPDIRTVIAVHQEGLIPAYNAIVEFEKDPAKPAKVAAKYAELLEFLKDSFFEEFAIPELEMAANAIQKVDPENAAFLRIWIEDRDSQDAATYFAPVPAPAQKSAQEPDSIDV